MANGLGFMGLGLAMAGCFVWGIFVFEPGVCARALLWLAAALCVVLAGAAVIDGWLVARGCLPRA
jgi:hypothetical protein